jgi:hypothetical protein
MSRINYQQNSIRGCFSRTRLIWPGPDNNVATYDITFEIKKQVIMSYGPMIIKVCNCFLIKTAKNN